MPSAFRRSFCRIGHLDQEWRAVPEQWAGIESPEARDRASLVELIDTRWGTRLSLKEVQVSFIAFESTINGTRRIKHRISWRVRWGGQMGSLRGSALK